MTSKGQITVPKDVRLKLNLKPGDRVLFIVENDGAVRMRAINKDISSLIGILPRPKRAATLEEIEAALGLALRTGEDDEEIDTLGGLVFLRSGRVNSINHYFLFFDFPAENFRLSGILFRRGWNPVQAGLEPCSGGSQKFPPELWDLEKIFRRKFF